MYRVECHIFAGLGGPLTSRGTRLLEDMIDQLPLEVDAHHHKHSSYERVTEGIIARAKRFGPAMTLLIGHSYGALRCQQISVAMAKQNLPVDYVAGIDPTALPLNHLPMEIPDNVLLVDEFHATRGIPARVRKRIPNGERGGKFVVPGNKPDRHIVVEVPGPHIASASDPITQTRIILMVQNLIESHRGIPPILV
ncbi:MAG: hypothetical protein AAGA53_10090 [Pseudomonadota bacterium]